MTEFPRPHIHRLIGSALYDLLIILGLLMIAGFLAVGAYYLMTGEESIPENNLFFQLYLLAVISGYFLYFWKKSGQTVGMKAWRIKLISQYDRQLGFKSLLLRQVTAIPAYGLLFLGVLWQYWDKAGLNWQDRASGTKMIYIPKK